MNLFGQRKFHEIWAKRSKMGPTVTLSSFSWNRFGLVNGIFLHEGT